MFKTYFRVIEKQKKGKTVYFVQERFFLFWWNLSQAIEDKNVADAIKLLVEYREDRKYKPL